MGKMFVNMSLEEEQEIRDLALEFAKPCNNKDTRVVLSAVAYFMAAVMSPFERDVVDFNLAENNRHVHMYLDNFEKIKKIMED